MTLQCPDWFSRSTGTRVLIGNTKILGFSGNSWWLLSVMFYADPSRRNTMVTLRTWGNWQPSLEVGAVYRLSPRLIDFNTTKILSALFEIDLRWASNQELYVDEANLGHHNVPFLQIIIDPNTLGRIPLAKEYIKTEGEIQKLFRDLKGLGNDVAGSLVLKASQHKAAQRILANRLSVIWGPPGTRILQK
jgi:hypothetical protein